MRLQGANACEGEDPSLFNKLVSDTSVQVGGVPVHLLPTATDLKIFPSHLASNHLITVAVAVAVAGTAPSVHLSI